MVSAAAAGGACGATAASVVAPPVLRSFWATCLTSAAPAVTIAAAARPATAFVASVLMPACSAPPAAAAAPPPAAAEPPEAAAVVPSWARIVFLSRNSGPTGIQRGHRAVVGAQLLAEARAAVARAQVAADRRGRAREALGDRAELDADLVAGQQPRLGGLGERHAGAHEQRLHRRDRGLHRLGDLLVGERVDLAQQQRGALRLGQVLHVGDQEPELLALVHLVGGGEAALGEVHVHRVHADRGRAAQVVERAVARDPVQPRAHVDLALVGEDRVVGGREDLLQHVLRVLLGGEHVPAERQQARLVAGDERLERVLVAAPDERDQALVGLQPQQRRASMESGYGAGLVYGRGFHAELPVPPGSTPGRRESCEASQGSGARFRTILSVRFPPG